MVLALLFSESPLAWCSICWAVSFLFSLLLLLLLPSSAVGLPLLHYAPLARVQGGLPVDRGDCSLGMEDLVFVSIALRDVVVTVIWFIYCDNICGFFAYSIHFPVGGYLLSGESRHLD